MFIDYLKVLGYDEKDNDNDENNADCFEMLEEAGLLECNLVDKANKPHWLHLRLLEVLMMTKLSAHHYIKC